MTRKKILKVVADELVTLGPSAASRFGIRAEDVGDLVSKSYEKIQRKIGNPKYRKELQKRTERRRILNKVLRNAALNLLRDRAYIDRNEVVLSYDGVAPANMAHEMAPMDAQATIELLRSRCRTQDSVVLGLLDQLLTGNDLTTKERQRLGGAIEDFGRIAQGVLTELFDLADIGLFKSVLRTVREMETGESTTDRLPEAPENEVRERAERFAARHGTARFDAVFSSLDARARNLVSLCLRGATRPEILADLVRESRDRQGPYSLKGDFTSFELANAREEFYTLVRGRVSPCPTRSL
jgi:hypothetical protein